MLWLELSASFFILAQIYFYGIKTPLGPILGIISAVLCIIHMILIGAWGFAPVNIIGFGLHIYNWRKWKTS